jgi:hypothetical protein
MSHEAPDFTSVEAFLEYNRKDVGPDRLDDVLAEDRAGREGKYHATRTDVSNEKAEAFINNRPLGKQTEEEAK